MEMHSPIVHTRKKSRWNPSAVGEAILRGAYSARTIPRWMPVMHDGQVVAAVFGHGDRTEVRKLDHQQWCGFQGVFDMRAKIKNGKYTRIWIWKDNSLGGPGQSWNDLWPCQGSSAVGTYTGTANTLRQFDNTNPSGLWFGPLTPAASETRHVVGWDMTMPAAEQFASMILYDRVASYDGCSISSVITTLTNTLAPLRYVAAGQEGLLVSVAVTAANGATASTLSQMAFTDQNGNTGVAQVAGYTQNYAPSFPSAGAQAAAQICVPRDLTNLISWSPILPLAANCSGVRKVESFTASATNTGTTCWALIHPIAVIPIMGGSHGDVELHKTLRSMERIYDGACLSALYHTVNSTTTGFLGFVKAAHG